MRLDHIAFRVKNRWLTAEFYINCLGYKLATEFDVELENSTAKCLVLEPPESQVMICPPMIDKAYYSPEFELHLAPEIFISDASNGIISDWVKQHGEGIHHKAYQIPLDKKIEDVMIEWKANGIEFLSDVPMECEGLRQIFTKPIHGVIYELIERTTQGFCKDNVRKLMESTQ